MFVRFSTALNTVFSPASTPHTSPTRTSAPSWLQALTFAGIVAGGCQKEAPTPPPPSVPHSPSIMSGSRSLRSGRPSNAIDRDVFNNINAIPEADHLHKMEFQYCTAWQYTSLETAVRDILNNGHPRVVAFGETHRHNEFTGHSAELTLGGVARVFPQQGFRDLVYEGLPDDLPRMTRDNSDNDAYNNAYNGRASDLNRLSGIGDEVSLPAQSIQNGFDYVYFGGPSREAMNTLVASLQAGHPREQAFLQGSRNIGVASIRQLRRILHDSRKAVFFGGSMHIIPFQDRVTVPNPDISFGARLASDGVPYSGVYLYFPSQISDSISNNVRQGRPASHFAGQASHLRFLHQHHFIPPTGSVTVVEYRPPQIRSNAHFYYIIFPFEPQ